MDTEVTWRKMQSEVTALLLDPRWADLIPTAQCHLPTLQQQFVHRQWAQRPGRMERGTL